MSAKPGVAQARHHKPRPRTNLSWQERANCLESDPRMFFEPTRDAEAQLVCMGCIVRASCARFGRGQEGVWGGVINRGKP